MKNIIFILSILTFLFTSCQKDDNEINNDQLIIEMGSICGWCAPGDVLVMTKSKTKYQFITPCDENDYTIDITTSLNEWDELIELLDHDNFSMVNINTCNYCADGCDNWIVITDENYSHKIRYGYEDSTTLITIKPFVDKLDSIRLSYLD